MGGVLEDVLLGSAAGKGSHAHVYLMACRAERITDPQERLQALTPRDEEPARG